MIKFLLRVLLVLVFLNGCGGSQSHVADNPASQRFRDVTGKLLPKFSPSLRQTFFLRANQDALSDLIVLNKAESEKPGLQIFINKGEEGFQERDSGRWIKEQKDPILSFTVADMNRDGGDDLILILKQSDGVTSQTLFNNKKGYFYAKNSGGAYPLSSGIDKVIPVDVDQDGDRDLFYFGKNVLGVNGKPARHQARILINTGKGNLDDLTSLLLPQLPAGVRDASFADYDGDGVVDIFLVYSNGQNRLLINNGVGKFTDRTKSLLPRILDTSQHADWADFDEDGDNDLLVVNLSIDKHYRAYPEETTYFLENTGGGHFKKRSDKMLPRIPSYKAYLLDANGNTKPDALILTSKGVYYLQGRSRWEFADETRRRLPKYRLFQEMTFADIDQDGFLDLFALSPESGIGRIWINRFD